RTRIRKTGAAIRSHQELVDHAGHLRDQLLEPLARLGDGRLGELARGDVRMRAGHAYRGTVGGALDHAPAIEYPDPAAVAMTHAMFGLVVRRPAGQMPRKRRVDGRPVVRVHEILPGGDALFELGEAIAQHCGPALVEAR